MRSLCRFRSMTWTATAFASCASTTSTGLAPAAAIAFLARIPTGLSPAPTPLPSAPAPVSAEKLEYIYPHQVRDTVTIPWTEVTNATGYQGVIVECVSTGRYWSGRQKCLSSKGKIGGHYELTDRERAGYVGYTYKTIVYHPPDSYRNMDDIEFKVRDTNAFVQIFKIRFNVNTADGIQLPSTIELTYVPIIKDAKTKFLWNNI